ncbi:MAG: ABC-F family ATP-binding cassette domain-containing protein [Chloroflexi bacterium]|nr:ABC-F family ATP-binding cassette domain-containing protein [Chloroflexota bacterium]
MSLLSTHHLSHAYGENDLIVDLSLRIEAGERIGMVGPNGVGKTTLLLILSGLLKPDEGEIARQADLTLGYLRQEAVLTFAGQENTIYQEMLSVFAHLAEQEKRLQELEAAMSGGELGEAVLEEYGRLQHAYEADGGYEYHINIKRVLLGLGFDEESWETPLSHLSGGQKTRLLLGRLLLEKPSLLILDEPTNHLDEAAVRWLETTLKGWAGALLIVSHDRYFLDKVVNRVWEMLPGQVRSYKGNYSGYVAQRQADFERELAMWTAEKERLDKELDFIRKNIAGGNSDMAKGRLKRLTRDITLLEEVGVQEMQSKSWLELGGRVRTLSANEAAVRLRDLTAPTTTYPTLNIKLKSQQRSGRLVLRTGRLTIGYPDTPLFQTGRIQLERRDCAALIGPNGSGKSTLLRTLLGQIPPLSGELELGENVQVGYFAQGHEQLNPAKRVLDEVLAVRPTSEQEARRYLAQYLFKAQDVFKRVGDLSGGERGRLALALLAATGANFLLLDEPTNHLDIPSQEVLQAVLEKFDGTILLVSHDRYLVNQLATQIWSLEADGQLHIFEGTYEEFVAWRDEKPSGEPEVKFGNLMSDYIEEKAKPDLSWLADVVEPEPKAKRGRGAAEIARRDAEIWLAKLEEEMAAARQAKDWDQLAWLEEEYEEALAKLGGGRIN